MEIHGARAASNSAAVCTPPTITVSCWPTMHSLAATDPARKLPSTANTPMSSVSRMHRGSASVAVVGR